ncbi:hypothetical protein BDA96_07G154200 [Sorghum bicolor]|uniref:Pyrroline-5-carboxylate reductase catalytic N-terminal domain-containing protein n=2 Tax=Sorghum bicolor TaxID=4558 RepID=A0A921QKU4_SORBI|nr:hypothetical protein BDA96_07G154200 [Sorghum bicolor]KXG25246.1 hypothetical protein SORBI_3007G143600 [Sorghum bicolor]
MATPPVQPVPPVVAVAALNADVFRLGFVGAATWPRASPAAWRRRASSQPPPSAPHPTAAPSAAVDDGDVIVISVKPQMVKQVLLELGPRLSEEKILVSIVAGIEMQDLQM